MKKYDLCVKSGTYTDRSGNEKINLQNIGVMIDDGSPYIMLKPYINQAGFSRMEHKFKVRVYYDDEDNTTELMIIEV